MCKDTVFSAAAKATTTYTGKQGETVVATGTATATSTVSYEDALDKAKQLAASIAQQNAQNNANVIDESVSISTSIGSNTELIYNKDGTLTSSPNLTFDDTTLLVKGGLQVGERNDGKDAYISGNVDSASLSTLVANLGVLNVTDKTTLNGKLVVAPSGAVGLPDYNTVIVGGAGIDELTVFSNVVIDPSLDKTQQGTWENKAALEVVGDLAFFGNQGQIGDSYNFGTLHQQGQIEVVNSAIGGPAAVTVSGGGAFDTLVVGPTGSVGETGNNVTVVGGAYIDALVVGPTGMTGPQGLTQKLIDAGFTGGIVDCHAILQGTTVMEQLIIGNIRDQMYDNEKLAIIAGFLGLFNDQYRNFFFNGAVMDTNLVVESTIGNLAIFRSLFLPQFSQLCSFDASNNSLLLPPLPDALVVTSTSKVYSSLSSFGYTFTNNETIDNVVFDPEATVPQNNSVFTILFYNDGTGPATINQLTDTTFINMYSPVTLNINQYATMTIKVLSLGNDWITPSHPTSYPVAPSSYIVTLDVQQ